MRAWRAVILVLLTVWPVGCLNFYPARSVSLFQARRAFQGPVGDDVVHVQLAVIERPVGDSYANEDIWKLADEQGIGFERKQVLQANGLRVCQIGGQPPAELLKLLLSQVSNPNPRGEFCHAGKPILQPLGPALASCSFQLRLDGETVPVHLDQAQCQIEVIVHLAEDNRFRLHFTPRIKHGEIKQKLLAVRNPSGVLEWGQRWEQDEEEHQALAWDV